MDTGLTKSITSSVVSCVEGLVQDKLEQVALGGPTSLWLCLCSLAGCMGWCEYSRDGKCDDGAAGSQLSVCEFGTDCIDCGIRLGKFALPCLSPPKVWEMSYKIECVNVLCFNVTREQTFILCAVHVKHVCMLP